MDFQLYDYDNSFVKETQELKNSWAIPSDGSMESNEEYFNWTQDLKLTLGNSKQFANNTIQTNNNTNSKIERKRKFFSNNVEVPRKVHANEQKDPLEGLGDKTQEDKPSGPRISSWQVDEIADNLTAELNGTLTSLSADFGNTAYNVSEALLSLPSLTVFKQEAPSPTSHENVASKRPNPVPITTSTANEFPDSNNNQNAINTTLQTLLANGYSAIQSPIENGDIVDSPSSQDSQRVVTSSDLSEDNRFQYVLAAATSIATKVNEDTLTYLNQGQSYEIKLKKLGDLSNYRGKILKSIIRICFYERRLQYMEKEQMSLWQSSRPGDRIVEVDVPLSYGLCEVTQPPNQLNAVHFLWDPTKEVGVYIKVNCISTEFTPKKHGGEKGVPFRIQVETYVQGDSMNPPKRLHAAACQIKVFKLKGADRKHKQDREKIMKRPLSEQEKYQPSYDCTVLNDIPNDAVIPAPLPALNGVTSTTVQGPYSPENASPKQDEAPPAAAPPVRAVPSLPTEDLAVDSNKQTVSAEFSVSQTAQWLSCNRFSAYLQTFQGFSGADMLRMSKEDLMQICGQADGIRLFNALHSKSIAPKLTMYVCREGSTVFHAIYLSSHSSGELCTRLSTLLGVSTDQVRAVWCLGPQGIHVAVTDDVLRHFKDDAMFSLDLLPDYVIVLKPIVK